MQDPIVELIVQDMTRAQALAALESLALMHAESVLD